MKRSNKKGFTIVELVIVIAIIAILAAVVIPTFASLVQKANESNALAEAKNLVTEMLANILSGGDDAADLIIVAKKGNEAYVHGYDASAGQLVAYKDNPVTIPEGANFYEQAQKICDAMATDKKLDAVTVPEDSWRNSEKLKVTVASLGFKAEETAVFANYTINADKFAAHVHTPEKTAIEKANEAIKKSGYAGESVTKALAAIGVLDVDTLVYKENGAVVAEKTYAYDPAKKEFIVVDLTDATLSSDLVYIVNAGTEINSKMTKIYINTAKDNAIAHEDFVKGSYFKAAFTMVEIGGSVAKVGDHCFYGSKNIQKVYIGSSVTEIGTQTFGNIKTLNYVYYNAGVETASNIGTSNSDTSQFRESGTNVTLVYGKDVKIIPSLFGGNTNDGKQVKSITFEAGIKYTQILQYAFKNFTCLTEINVPSTCTRIDGSGTSGGAFMYTGLNRLVWNGDKITVGGTEYYEGANLNQGSPANLAYYLARNTGARDNVLDLVVGNTTYKAKNFGGYFDNGNRVPDNMTVEVYENGVLSTTYEYKDSKLQEKPTN